ncbi:MAG: outer membrane beta-barrel protein [Bacteroidia bacterium]|nr:outer membrane beta-barrel protein [Bacteroidia bacterium]
MKRIVLAASFSLIFLLGYGQQSFISRVGYSLSPNMNYRVLKNTNGSELNDVTIRNRDDEESMFRSLGAELKVGHDFGNHLNLETGIGYTRMGYSTVFTPTFGPLTPDEPDVFRILFNENFDYLSVPLRLIVRTSSSKKGFRLVGGVGISAGFLTRASVTSIEEMISGKRDRKTVSSSTDYNTFNLFPEASLGMDAELSDKLTIHMGPSFRYGILNIIDKPINGFLWTASFDFAYYYAFN